MKRGPPLIIRVSISFPILYTILLVFKPSNCRNLVPFKTLIFSEKRFLWCLSLCSEFLCVVFSLGTVRLWSCHLWNSFFDRLYSTSMHARPRAVTVQLLIHAMLFQYILRDSRFRYFRIRSLSISTYERPFLSLHALKIRKV